jgi:hypothetical protein
MATTTTQNMDLIIPVVSSEPGPQYASEINTALETIDSHDHSNGKGVPVTPSGMSITSDLSMINNHLTNTQSVRFTSLGAVLSGASDLRSVYSVGADLYYNDGNGNNIRMTQSGGVAGSPGSITNLTSPAAVTYVSASTKFVFQSAANTAADLDARSVIFRNSAASSYGVTLTAPPAMTSDTNISLPNIPSVTSFLLIANTGAIATPVAYNAGIQGFNIASRTVAASNIVGSTITFAEIANRTITGSNIATNTVAKANLTSLSVSFAQVASEVVVAGTASFFINLSTSGRPVMLVLTSTTNGYMQSASSGSLFFDVSINASGIGVTGGARFRNQSYHTGITSSFTAYGNQLTAIAFSSAGLNEYYVQFANSDVRLINMIFYAYEL